MAKGWNLVGKVVLITGPARGIGNAVARGLHAKGARVALVGLEPELLKGLSHELGSNAMWVEADITDPAALERAVAAVVAKFGGIDALFLNAGIGTFGTCATIAPAHFERVIEVNFLGTWRSLRAALHHVVERKGYILFNASIAAAIAVPGLAAYCASKAAVEALGDSLRVETRHQGVNVGVAYCSWIDTDLVKTAQQSEGMAKLWARMPGPLREKVPLAVAARALVKAFEDRAERVMVPRALRAVLPLRWAITMLASKLAIIGQEVERATNDTIREVGGAANVPTSEPGTGSPPKTPQNSAN
jgi:NAD(P)-dependent dehydrogenase (short-subunit alcohol dehydrogenase family)